MNTEQVLQSGIAHHQAGRLAEAERAYREILAHQPDHPGALHLLGLLAGQAGQVDLGVSLIRRAMALQPQESVFPSNLSKLLLGAGRKDEALALQQQVVMMHPHDAVAYSDLGAMYQAFGKIKEAIAAYREALRLNPDHASAHNNLGVMLMDEYGRGEGGRAGSQAATLAEATEHYRRAIQHRPQFAEAHANLGRALYAQGMLEEAVASYRQAIALNPKHPEFLFDLGFTLNALSRAREAANAYYAVLRIQPDHAKALNNLATLLSSVGQLDEAVKMFQKTLSFHPQMAEAHANLGATLEKMGELDASIAAFRKALEIKPDFAVAHSSLVYLLHFHPDSTRQSLYHAHRQWDVQQAAPLRSRIQPHTNNRDPERRLRIGYISPDFRNHSVGRFMLPLLEEHNRSGFEVFCYADGRVTDAITDRLRSHADHWRSLVEVNDQRVAELVRQDRIDILVDLTMHMQGSRLLVFAEKPAPVQVTYLAFCSTTGMETIDYRITDQYLDPPDGDLLCYSEKSVYVASYWCYAPSPHATDVNDLPALKSGGITWACLNSFNKVSAEALEIWAQLLIAFPTSRLILHAHPGSHRERIRDIFSRKGIQRPRIEFLDRQSGSDYFKSYHQIDICLDPFPYAGGTTTCDALYMGVPVVTLAGQIAVGRGGVSIHSQIGQTTWIAETRDQYIQIASTLAADLNALQTIRQKLRDQMCASPLMDAKRCAADLENGFRTMWREWCRAGNA